MWNSDILMRSWKTNAKHYYNRRDMILFALGIGCKDLKYIHENDREFKAFCTLPMTLLWRTTSPDITHPPLIRNDQNPENIFNLPRLPKGASGVDAYRILEIVKPLPAGGDTLKSTSELSCIQQTKKGVFFETQGEIRSSNDELLCRTVYGLYCTKLKGLESKGRSKFQRVKIPSSQPDWMMEEFVGETQHALFRLSGNYYPGHIDPEVAEKFGFPAPLVHGLCTLGISVRKILAKQAEKTVRRVGVRFSAPVFPGQKLEIRAWNITPFKTIFTTKTVDAKRFAIEGFIDFLESSRL